MAIGTAYLFRMTSGAKKFFRALYYRQGLSPIIKSFIFTYGIFCIFKPIILQSSFKRFQIANKKKNKQRDDQLKEFTSEQVFFTLDQQQVKLKELQDQFVILIKSSNINKLNDVNKILGELSNYRYTAMIVLDDFNKKQEFLKLDISNNAFFVVSKSQSTLVQGNIYILYPDDNEMLMQMPIPQGLTGFGRTLKLKMNKKLDQLFKKSINFSAK